MTYTAPTGAGNVTTRSGTSGASLSVSKPSNLANGDFLYLACYKQATGATFTTPSGFALVYKAVASGTRGLALYAKQITSAAGEPSTYSVTSSDSVSRWLIAAFRLPGLSATSDAAPASDVFSSVSQTTVTDPSVASVSNNTVLLALNFSNNSTAVYQTFTSSGWTEISTSTVLSGSSTSVMNVSYKELTAAGASGSSVFTMSPAAASSGGFQVTLPIAPTPATSAGSITITGTASPSGTGSSTASGSISIDGTSPASAAATATGGISITGSALGSSGAVGRWLTLSPMMCAHRGGWASTLGEETLAAYTKSAAWNPDLALEMSVWRCSTGEWVLSHDQTTGRVFSANYDIPSTPWSTLQALTTLNGGNPIAKLDDLLPIFATGNRVIFIDNKGQTNSSTLLTLLASHGGPQRFIAKNYGVGNVWRSAAAAQGYRTWGYFYDTDMANVPTYAPTWDLLGMDLGAPAADWTAIKSYGKPVLAHIVDTGAHYTLAQTYSPAGYMVSDIPDVIPYAATAAGTVTVTGAATARATAAAAGTVEIVGQAAGVAAAAASGALAITGASTAAARGAADGALAITGQATGRASATAAGVVSINGQATGTAQTAAAGTVTITGTAASANTTTAAGAITVTGTATATATVTASGTISVTGSVIGRAVATAAGFIAIAGAATASAAHEWSTAPERTVAIPAESRTVTVAAESRTTTIPAEDRTVRVRRT